MRIAVCPGSFDPITKGHMDIINRASKLFDKVIVLVSINLEKQSTFHVEERVRLINMSIAHMDNVEVDTYKGLLAEYVSLKNACAIVKGLRAVSDFEYEFQMALANKKLNDQAETVFLTTSAENMYLSSSVVRQIASLGGNIEDFVPECTLDIIKKRFEKSEEK
ncbi:MAG: coaD [Oscillospiraceae bacterium]|jgi:pantetheine-phosphate adenylyltransferase|nr:coaD [Oscillospiraceae bacterium]